MYISNNSTVLLDPAKLSLDIMADLADIPVIEEVPHTHDQVSFTYPVASRGFHHYSLISWQNVYEGERIYIHKETDPESLRYDRYACAIKTIIKSTGVLIPTLSTVGHVPLEISKYCYYFIQHDGEINGKVVDLRPRRSPIPSGGLEIKLLLNFKARGRIADKMKQLLRDSYAWEYMGEQGALNEEDTESEPDLEL